MKIKPYVRYLPIVSKTIEGCKFKAGEAFEVTETDQEPIFVTISIDDEFCADVNTITKEQLLTIEKALEFVYDKEWALREIEEYQGKIDELIKDYEIDKES